jgi:alkylation response protein AidB-like acyl-CoA dehydrogenase
VQDEPPLTLIAKAELLAAEFAASAAELDRTGAFSHANFQRLREAGLLALTAPERLGGGGAKLSEVASVIGTIAKGEPSTALILVMQYFKLASLPLVSSRNMQLDQQILLVDKKYIN